MKVIIINGPPQSGKDKFVKLFREISGLRVKNLSSVDKIKSIAEIGFGWNGKKNEKSRKFLSDIKKAWTEYNDGPTNDILNKIEIDTEYCLEKNKKLNKNIYFLHIREPHEISKIKDIYGDNCITLLIKKDVELHPNNSSDQNVGNYDYQHIINNNGTINDLKTKIKEFMYLIL